MSYKLYTDGGARGNPGPGAIGIVIMNDKDEVIYEASKYIGKCTNNEAEYTALQQGLKDSLDRKIESLDVFMDSELVVKQLNGEYKVKNDRLKDIYNEIKKISTGFSKVTYSHIKREKNKKADLLVNEALDGNGF